MQTHHQYNSTSCSTHKHGIKIVMGGTPSIYNMSKYTLLSCIAKNNKERRNNNSPFLSICLHPSLHPPLWRRYFSFNCLAPLWVSRWVIPMCLHVNSTVPFLLNDLVSVYLSGFWNSRRKAWEGKFQFPYNFGLVSRLTSLWSFQSLQVRS